MARLVVVSNRVADPRKTQAGGLAVALGDVLARSGGLWMGASDRRVPADVPEAARLHIGRAGPVTLVTLDLTQEDHDRYYRGYANGVLWPVFHNRLDLAEFDAGHLDGYRRVNRSFAQHLRGLLQPDDVIWVHDYHLIPLAAELRALGCQQRIGFFLHIPMPVPLNMAAIPAHDWLVRALFAYDLVGLQSEGDVAHLRRYLLSDAGAQMLGPGVFASHGRVLRAGAYPIGMDVQEFVGLLDAEPARRMEATVRHEYAGQRLLVGVDRLDYSKGLPQRVKAFRSMLASHPSLRGRSTLIQIAAPSREDVDAYGDIRREMEALCGSINGDFGDLGWMPIRYIHRAIARNRLPGLYRASGVGLVTPLRDGMNLVAKEYVCAQDPADPGVLVLSKFAGAAEQLRDALIVNPYDIEETGQAIARALTMERAERQARHQRLLETIRDFDVHWWHRRFLADLADTTAVPSPPESGTELPGVEGQPQY